MDEPERIKQIQLAVNGNGDALQRLIVEYHDPLCRAVISVLTSDGRYVEPEDVLQDAYVAAVADIAGRTFATPGAFYNWLKTIALNRLRDLGKASHRMKRGGDRRFQPLVPTSSSLPGLADILESDDQTPSRILQRSEKTAAILSSMARLPDDQRDVIQLRYLEGRRVPEVAEMLGKTDDQVHGLCRRALHVLREHYSSISQFLSAC